MKIGFIVSLILIVSIAFSQTSLSGIVNTYYGVSNVNNASATLTVNSTAGLASGDFLLLIQMKGANIDLSASVDYGNINAYNGAGNYELVEICDIDGNDLILKGRLLNSYDATGSVQLISFPDFNAITIDGKIMAQNWNGTTGGVVFMRAQTYITFNDSIDVSSQGFRGGAYQVSPFDCSFLFTIDAYEYESSSGLGAMKGEGISQYTLNDGGRGALANGGGGGNDHNSGGGGGANVASGGMGGINDEPSTFNCRGDFPGEGGKALVTGTNRIFLGGGGGSGHCNSTFNNKAGNGGGLVILMANEIIGNGHRIVANGEDGLRGFGDGGSGGGAGGSVVLYADNYSSTLNIEANGGNGGNGNGSYLDDMGNVFNSASFRCFGPGGGGGGGLVWFKGGSTPSGINIANTGGISGVVSNTQETSCAGSPLGAAPGNGGGVQFNAAVLSSNKLNKVCEYNPQLDIGNDTIICYAQNLLLTAQLSGIYEWSTGETTQSILVTNGGEYWVKVEINGWLICDTIIISNNGLNVDLGPDQNICGEQVVTLDAGPGAISYLWSTSEITQSIEVVQGGTYSIETDDGNCINADEIVIIECVENLFIPDTITPNSDGENDFWIIEGLEKYPGNSVIIMNRNGSEVFKKTDYDNSWNGESLPSTTYYYVVELNDGISFFKGTITIIRQQ